MDIEFFDSVEQNYNKSPQYYREEFRDLIKSRRVALGMWPTEALLAAGGGIYKVKADPKKWQKNSNPIEVMKAQSISPDDSEIEIRFHNSWQFDGNFSANFVVHFKHGVATDILEID